MSGHHNNAYGGRNLHVDDSGVEHVDYGGVEPFVEHMPHRNGVGNVTSEVVDEKKLDGPGTVDVYAVHDLEKEPALEVDVRHLDVTAQDLEETEAKLSSMSLERCMKIMRQVYLLHKHDQNFPVETIEDIDELLNNPDVAANPNKHQQLILRCKLEALLVTENSPYAIVRAVVDPTDDPSLPTLTFRVWVIGVIFCGIGTFINSLFSQRAASVSVTTIVAQLVAWPCGKGLEMILPKNTYFNPGPFNKKEHMLITIMTNVGMASPYTSNIIISQAMPQYFNEQFARNFGYQVLNSLGSSLIGYGLAGTLRRFLVWPSYAVWPNQLVTLALNKAFHSDDYSTVPGPFGTTWAWSRMKMFTILFCGMFVYFWIPNFLFQALSNFNWMGWIAPDNVNLVALTNMNQNNGMGFNPISTFDWNTASSLVTPFVTPWFTVLNTLIGMLIAGMVIIGIWYTNAWNTAYFPINSNKIYTNRGKIYNISMIVDEKRLFNMEKYQKYSEVHMAAGNITLYIFFFAFYTSLITYTALYHRHEVAIGFQSAWRSMKRTGILKRFNHGPQEELDDDLSEDIHYRLMKQYKEVPDWWYLVSLLVAIGLGMAGVGGWPTNTTPAVVLFGFALALFFMVPIGLIYAVTGVQVTLNVIGEFIGASWFPGNAISMNFFKTYGLDATMNALSFTSDLKLAHYSKIPQRDCFIVQTVGTLIMAIVGSAVFNLQLSFKDICTDEAAFKMTCPGVNTFFTASVFWGTIGPKRVFGGKGRYKLMLLGFPIGLVTPLIIWLLQKKFKKNHFLRLLHPVVIFGGGVMWAPTNIGWLWPGLVLSWLSWIYVKPRYLSWWSKYNYIVAGAFMAGSAIAALVVFFALNIPDVSIDWWGNDADKGCNLHACPRFKIPEKGYFGPDPGNFI